MMYREHKRTGPQFATRVADVLEGICKARPDPKIVRSYFDPNVHCSKLQDWVLMQPGIPFWAQGIEIIEGAERIAKNVRDDMDSVLGNIR